MTTMGVGAGSLVYRAGDEPIPGYRLIRRLGHGNSGEVWVAEGPGQVHMALKIVDLQAKIGKLELLALAICREVRHPNLVPIFAFWLKNGSGEVVAPQIDTDPRATATLPRDPIRFARNDQHAAQLIIAMGLGDTDLFRRLQQVRKQGAQGLPVAELIEALEPIAKALDLLNTGAYRPQGMPIQHCDVKPANILLVGGATQLCDLGVARIVGDIRWTSPVGSLAYAGPEIPSGRGYFPQSDQYALAVTYYELRTGQLPYRGQGNELIASIAAGQLELGGVPRAEQRVLRRSLAREPSARFESCAQFMAALHRATQVRAGWGWRRALLLTVVASLLLLGAAGGWLYRDRWWPAEQLPLPRWPERPLELVDPTLPTATPSSASHILLREGSLAFERGEFNSAVSLLTRALDQSEETLPEAWLIRGSAQLELGRLAEAENDLTRAIEHSPQDGRAWSRRGTCRLRAARWNEARDDFLQALNREPHPVDHQGLGMAHLMLGDLPAALAAMETALVLAPQSADALYGRGLALAAADRYTEAERDFSASLFHGPTYPPDVLDALALAERQLGRVAAAERDLPLAAAWRGALNSTRGTGPLLGVVTALLNDPDARPWTRQAARRVAQAAVDRGAGVDHRAWRALAVAQIAAGDRSGASRSFQAAIDCCRDEEFVEQLRREQAFFRSQ